MNKVAKQFNKFNYQQTAVVIGFLRAFSDDSGFLIGK